MDPEEIARVATGKAFEPKLLTSDASTKEIKIPPRDYIVPGYIQRGVVTLLVGPPSAGKSLLVLNWAVGLVIRQQFGEFKSEERLRVALFNAEDDLAEQERRVAAALRNFSQHMSLFGVDNQDLRGRLLLMNPDHSGMLLMHDKGIRGVRHTELMRELIAVLDEFQPDLLILDPLSELHDAQENDNTALRHIVAELRVIARTRNIGILLLHHTPKGVPRPGDQDAGRGASAISGVVRKSYTLYEMTKEEAKQWNIAEPQLYFRLDGAKANYDAKNSTDWFQRVPIELGNGDMTAAVWPWEPPQEVITGDIVTRLLEAVAAGDSGQPWSKQLGKYGRSIGKALAKLGIHSAVKQREAIQALLGAGCTEADWKTKNRAKAKGLRHPDGRPPVDWQD